ncbi:hypothetical protein [Nocardia sp. CA-145437]|uniref:hypothetical protein n=1 Tax=Nocardia sp. CA-145437 TaxID=3239980 RepID=UPI003D97FA1C
MTSTDSRSRYEQLRIVAIRVLDALPNAEHDPEGLRAALIDLHLALEGNEPTAAATDARPVQDPARHLRGCLDYTRTPTRPVELGSEAHDLRQELAADRHTRGFDAGAPERIVELTGRQGMIIGSLLRELDARLRPGSAFGSSREGIPLADVASDLADRILNQTVIGRG